MSKGSRKDYRFGQKNNWRRTLWNDVLSRTNGREKVDPILYLAGPDDLDREIAIRKGVPSRNLIAIDRSYDNVDNIRSVGNPALHSDALDVLRAWPRDVSVCALVFDFCCGLINQDWMADISNLTVCRKPFRDAVLAMNFMRGRDAATQLLREESSRMIAFIKESSAADLVRNVDGKHRGFAFAMFHGMIWCLDMETLRTNTAELGDNLNVMVPRFMSYKSGGLVFDSVVLSPLSRIFDFTQETAPDLEQISRDVFPKDSRVARKIAAMLAVRTRRTFPTKQIAFS